MCSILVRTSARRASKRLVVSVHQACASACVLSTEAWIFCACACILSSSFFCSSSSWAWLFAVFAAVASSSFLVRAASSVNWSERAMFTSYVLPLGRLCLRPERPDDGFGCTPEFVNAVGGDQSRDSAHYRVGTDQPEDRERAGSGPDRHDASEDDRQRSGGADPGCAADLAVQVNGGDDLEDAGHDRPGRDEVDQRQGGHRRCEESHNADTDPGQTTEDERHPVRAPVREQVEPAADRKDAVDECECAEQRGQSDQRDARPDQDDHSEDDRPYAGEGEITRGSLESCIHR